MLRGTRELNLSRPARAPRRRAHTRLPTLVDNTATEIPVCSGTGQLQIDPSSRSSLHRGSRCHWTVQNRPMPRSSATFDASHYIRKSGLFGPKLNSQEFLETRGSSSSWVNSGRGENLVMSAADFTNLYEELAADIRRYVGARVSGELIDDLTAQVFADAWASRYRFDSELGVLRAWIFGLAKNHVRRHFRSKMRHDRAFAGNSDYGLHMPDEDVSDWIDAEVARPELFSALRQLRSVDRELFLLHAIDGLTYAEFSHATGAPIGTIRSRLSRTRSRLRSELQSLGSDITDGVKKSGGSPDGAMLGDPSAGDPC